MPVSKMGADEKTEFAAALREEMARLRLALDEEGIERLAAHYAMLVKWNRRVNLTRVVEAREAARLHYAESLFGAPYVAGARALLDIGSGAGFPAVPLAVARPEVAVTALEAHQKKALFLAEAKDALRLTNLTVAAARFEAFDWSGFDVLTSRAVERAASLWREIPPRLRAGQRLMLYCAREMAEVLAAECAPLCGVEIHAIPETRSRVVAIYEPLRSADVRCYSELRNELS